MRRRPLRAAAAAADGARAAASHGSQGAQRTTRAGEAGGRVGGGGAAASDRARGGAQRPGRRRMLEMQCLGHHATPPKPHASVCPVDQAQATATVTAQARGQQAAILEVESKCRAQLVQSLQDAQAEHVRDRSTTTARGVPMVCPWCGDLGLTHPPLAWHAVHLPPSFPSTNAGARYGEPGAHHRKAASTGGGV